MIDPINVIGAIFSILFGAFLIMTWKSLTTLRKDIADRTAILAIIMMFFGVGLLIMVSSGGGW